MAWSCLLQSLTNQISSLRLSLGSDDGGEFLLLGLFNNVASSFGILLGNLLLLYCCGKFFSKGKMGDGDIL
jgi:hypothetical protein